MKPSAILDFLLRLAGCPNGKFCCLEDHNVAEVDTLGLPTGRRLGLFLLNTLNRVVNFSLRPLHC